MGQISIPFADVLGPEVTDDIWLNINIIIHETFLITADEDYLNARFLAFNHHHRSFYWSAAQCIEKYCKANLLLLGVSVTSFSHNIVEMYRQLKIHDKRFAKLELTIPNQLSELKEHWGSAKTCSFISAVAEYGNPDNRYDYTGIRIEPSTLFKLDQLVYLLRSNITNTVLYEHCKLSTELQKHLYDNNFQFAPINYVHSSFYKMNASFRMTTTCLEMVLKGKLGHKNIYKAWLEDNIKINANSKKFK